MSADSSQTSRAVGVIIFTVFALSLGDALIKDMSAGFSLWQIFVLRSVLVVPVLLVVIKIFAVKVALWPVAPGWTILRSMMLTVMWIAYYAALPKIALSAAAAVYYTLPLFITLFAAIFLGDAIGKTGWVAIFLGFVGVVMVLEPRLSDFNWYAVLPLLAAILFALAMIMTNSLCREESVLVLSLWLNLSMLFIGIIGSAAAGFIGVLVNVEGQAGFLTTGWAPMGAGQWMTIITLSLSILIGSIGAAYAYQRGKPATIAAFDFAYVAFAVVWGYVFFQEVPGAKAIAGMALIVIAGVLAVRGRGARE